MSLMEYYPPFILGTVHYHFLGLSRCVFEVGQPRVLSLVKLHRCAGWPRSILVAKTNHFWFQQDKEYSFKTVLMREFEIQFC